MKSIIKITNLVFIFFLMVLSEDVFAFSSNFDQMLEAQMKAAQNDLAKEVNQFNAEMDKVNKSLQETQDMLEKDLPLLPNKSDKVKNKTEVTYEKIPSLMYTKEQILEINKVVETMRLSPEARRKELLESETGSDSASTIKPKENNEKSYIYLGSILYFSPKTWAVWINGEKISSQTNSNTQEIYVTAIGRDKVQIMWQISFTKWKILTGYEDGEELPELTADNKVRISFTLKPNQTFILGSNKIVEGKVSPSIITQPEPEQPEQSADPFAQEIPQ